MPLNTKATEVNTEEYNFKSHKLNNCKDKNGGGGMTQQPCRMLNLRFPNSSKKKKIPNSGSVTPGMAWEPLELCFSTGH